MYLRGRHEDQTFHEYVQNCNEVRLPLRASDLCGAVLEILTSADVPPPGVGPIAGLGATRGAATGGGAGDSLGAEINTGATEPHQETLFLPASISA
mmetsp:Transcript_32052/g.57962  ORF Transcript_32052/g.57962 Transcript_32052/m.57962 type:complete len:96 (+) Transcript_32052:94-381(+)